MKEYIKKNGYMVKTFLSWTDSENTRKNYPGLRTIALCSDDWFHAALNAIRDSSVTPGELWYEDSVDIYDEVRDLRPATTDEIKEYLGKWSISDEERMCGLTAIALSEGEYGTQVVFKYTWKNRLRDQFFLKSPRFVLKLLEKIGLLEYYQGIYIWNV